MPRPRRDRTAASKASGKSTGKSIETLRHEQDTRTNIPTAEYQSMVREEESSPFQVAYQRRNRDLDPQLVWRGKDEQDLDDLVVNVPPLYIQEKIHPKALVDDLLRQSKSARQPEDYQTSLFADFNGLPDGADRTEFYRHDANWSNRMVLGDSLQVMASLSEREGLQGKVQCIYVDPPYGIRFNSNFQWSTTSRDVRDGNREHITREPEQVKAFRDTWRDGIHSYLTYLRDRLTVARDLLADSGSIFVQIGDENVHRVRALLDEVFGAENFVAQVTYKVTSGFERSLGPRRIQDYIIWFARQREQCKFRRAFTEKRMDDLDFGLYKYLEQDGVARPLTPQERRNPKDVPPGARVFMTLPLHTMGTEKREPRQFEGETYTPPSNTQWRHTETLFGIIANKAGRVRQGRESYTVQIVLRRTFHLRKTTLFGMILGQNWRSLLLFKLPQR